MPVSGPYNRTARHGEPYEDDIQFSGLALAGFVRITTHPRILPDPAPAAVSLAFIQALIDAPRSRWFRGAADTWKVFHSLCLADAGIRGNLVPDAVIAAAASAHGARVATADHGFARYGVPFFDSAERAS